MEHILLNKRHKIIEKNLVLVASINQMSRKQQIQHCTLALMQFLWLLSFSNPTHLFNIFHVACSTVPYEEKKILSELKGMWVNTPRGNSCPRKLTWLEKKRKKTKEPHSNSKNQRPARRTICSQVLPT